jgi:hypothetical protein
MNQRLLGPYRWGQKVVAAQGKPTDLALVQCVPVLLSSFPHSPAMLDLHERRRVVLDLLDRELDTGHVAF